MGREVRRVPPNWAHPTRDCPHEPWRGGCSTARRNGGRCYQPLHDQDVEAAWARWQNEFAAWLSGEHDRVIAEYGEADYPKAEPYRAFCAWHGGPPDPAYYRPKWPDGMATWFQVYQTVSEGSPVTPAFATKEELVEYLATNGDFWDQDGRREGDTSVPCGPWDRKAAEAFVGVGWAPSMIVKTGPEGAEIRAPRDGPPTKEDSA